MRRYLTLVITVLFLLLAILTPPAHAQAATPDVNNPTGVSFTASADQAQISRYDVDIVSSAGVVIQTLNAGKPTPDASNVITVPLNVQPIAFATGYSIRVRAVAGTASSVDAVSVNKFNRIPLAVVNVTIK